MKYIVAANWKCNPTDIRAVEKFLRKFVEGIKRIKKTEIIIFPPFVYLPFFKKRSKKIKFGAQNIFYESSGAFTGEISPSMVKNLGCSYVILGHSERRKYFKETDEMINKKIKAALANNLIPVVCVGENLEERREKKTFDVLRSQLKLALKQISRVNLIKKKIIVAYEPVWAIGKGKACPPKDIETVSLFIRKLFFKSYGMKVADSVKILYGGSVNSRNIEKILKQGRVNGLLVGSSSLNPKEFLKIIKTADNF